VAGRPVDDRVGRRPRHDAARVPAGAGAEGISAVAPDAPSCLGRGLSTGTVVRAPVGGAVCLPVPAAGWRSAHADPHRRAGCGTGPLSTRQLPGLGGPVYEVTSGLGADAAAVTRAGAGADTTGPLRPGVQAPAGGGRDGPAARPHHGLSRPVRGARASPAGG